MKPQLGTVSASGAAFLSYAALSALWAERPMTAIGWPLLSAVTALCCGIAVRSFLSEPRRNILHIGEGVWVGMIAGLAYLAAEILSHQWIKISLFNYLHLGPEDLKPHDHFLGWRPADVDQCERSYKKYCSYTLFYLGCSVNSQRNASEKIRIDSLGRNTGFDDCCCRNFRK